MTDAVRPVLLVVSRSAKVRDLLREELLHRYDRDYDVVTAGSPDEARERLAGDGQAAGGQAPVALLRYAGSLDWGSAAAWVYGGFLLLVTATAAAGVRLTSGSRP